MTHHDALLLVPLQLGAGESRLVRASHGSVLLSTSGRLTVTTAPVWLGGQVFRATLALVPGQPHAIDQDGWITLTAGAHEHAVCLLSPGQGLSLTERLGRVGKALARVLHACRSGLGHWQRLRMVERSAQPCPPGKAGQ